MKRTTFIGSASAFALSAALATCLIPTAAFAKLSVPYGEDGGPKDSEAQQEADAVNEALEGPEPGQSWESWERELEAAVAALHDSSPSGATNASVSTEPFTFLSSNDLCQDPLQLWVPNTSTELVSDALADAGQRAALVDELETIMYWILLMQAASTGIEFDPPVITQLRCDACEMTYMECLESGQPWPFCKSHYLTCPTEPQSSLSVTLSVTAPVSGTITASGSATSEISLLNGDEYPDQCFTLHDYEFEGFGLFTEALIGANIEQVLGDGHFCLYDR